MIHLGAPPWAAHSSAFVISRNPSVLASQAPWVGKKLRSTTDAGDSRNVTSGVPSRHRAATLEPVSGD